MNSPSVSIILPVYQNQESLEELYSQLKSVCQNDFHEILFINDASTDNSQSIIDELAKKDSAVVAHHLKQNVGQHRAALKGIEMSRGSAVIIMDADLQDPPEMIPTLLSKLQEGYDAVFAGKHGNYESPIRLLTSKIFKYLLHLLCKLPKDAGMYVVLTRSMIEALGHISMPSPFLVAMIGLTGLKTYSIPFTRQKRPGGRTTYTASMRLKIALKTLYQVLILKRKAAQANQQRKYYAKADHKSIYPENYPTYIEKQIAKALSHLPITPEQKVLEIGSGMGRFTIPLSKKDLQIEALDISSALLEKLNAAMPSIPTHCADLHSLPPQLEGQYDIVIGFFILHHLPDLEKTFQAISSLLKPGGKILFIEPNPYNCLYYLQILFHPKMRWKNERYMLKMRPGPVFSAMKNFSNHKKERFGFFPPFLHQKLGRLEQKLEKISPFQPFLPYQIFFAEKN